MSNGPLEIKAISGHAGPVPGRGASRDYDVAKLIDVTTCSREIADTASTLDTRAYGVDSESDSCTTPTWAALKIRSLIVYPIF